MVRLGGNARKQSALTAEALKEGTMIRVTCPKCAGDNVERYGTLVRCADCGTVCPCDNRQERCAFGDCVDGKQESKVGL